MVLLAWKLLNVRRNCQWVRLRAGTGVLTASTAMHGRLIVTGHRVASMESRVFIPIGRFLRNAWGRFSAGTETDTRVSSHLATASNERTNLTNALSRAMLAHGPRQPALPVASQVIPTLGRREISGRVFESRIDCSFNLEAP